MDHFTETTTTSFGENIGNSFKGIFFGLLLIIASIVLLSYNEHRSINQTWALEEIGANIVTLENTQYNPEYQHKPLLIQGEVKPIKPLEDREFGVKSNDLLLKRHVMMYQWREKKTTKSTDKMGGGTETVTTYDYTKEWASHPIDSSVFKDAENHRNPSMPYDSKTFATDANVGDYYLSEGIVGMFGSGQKYEGLSDMASEIKGFKNHHTFLYKGEDKNGSMVGDLKVSYTVAPKGVYSIIGMAEGKSIHSYISENDIKLLFVRKGRVSSDQILQEESTSNTILTWILRFAGLLLMFFGFIFIMGLLITFANVIPLVGSLLEGLSSLVAIMLTLLLGSIVIAIAWFASRPMFSLTIIAVGVVLTLILSLLKNRIK